MQDFLYRFRNRMQSFLYGRNGLDNLAKHVYIVGIVLMLVNMFFNFYPLSVITTALLLYSIYRMFSKDIVRRRAENEKYVTFLYKQKMKWQRFQKRYGERHIYRYYKCKNCKQTVRVPRGKGKIEITCPKCKYKFIKRS